MSNGPGEPPSTPANPPPSDPPTLPVSEGGLDSDDRMVIRVVEEFTQTVEEANREQSRIVIVTAMVALVSAIAGPLVSLKINSDQIDSQRTTAQETNVSEEKRSEGEFIRTERRVAYTDYLTTLNNGAVDMTEIGGKLSAAGYPLNLIGKEIRKLTDLIKDGERDYYAVTLVGSGDARDQAKNAKDEFTNYYLDLNGFAIRRISGQQISAAEFRQTNRAFITHYNRLVTLSAAFIDSARVDVAANDSGD